jgi:3-oxoacyl-[acyl-carrier-protein] synthase-3
MDGQEVFRFAVSSIEREIGAALAALGAEPSEVRMFLLHQANRRIIESARKRLEQPEEKFPVNINTHGNTSSASIPILMDELLENGKSSLGDLLILSTFGGGLTTCTAALLWE